MKQSIIFVIILLIAASIISAQERPQYFQLDPKSYDPDVDVNTDLFMNHFKMSRPKPLHGDLVVRDIFVPLKGDTLNPAEKGAVLTILERVSRFTIPGGKSSGLITLRDKQEILYVTDGAGEVRSANITRRLHSGVGVLIPAGVTAEITNSGTAELSGYLWVEPLPVGFTPKTSIAVSDINAIPMSERQGHWANHSRTIFTKKDGLATLIGFSHITLKPMTMAQPHASRPTGTDVVWIALDGNIYTLFGKKLYHLEPGTAFKNPSDSKVYHANINVSDFNEIHLIWSRTMPPGDFKK